MMGTETGDRPGMANDPVWVQYGQQGREGRGRGG